METAIAMSSIVDAFNDAVSLSDDIYAEELQLQEALEASLKLSTVLHQTSSSISSISCEICTEDKQKSDMFQVEGCPHSFCSLCMSKHVEYKLQESIIMISCPDHNCANTIVPGSLRFIVPQEVIDRWEEAIAESTIVESQKIRCPFENCSEMIVDDDDDDDDEGVVITECECPWCHRLFCAKCKVPWHHEFDCKEFQRSDKNEKDKGLRLLAKENKWKKCPNCKVFVDKIDGCIHITCRCQFEFCYICGAIWNESHWSTCQE